MVTETAPVPQIGAAAVDEQGWSYMPNAPLLYGKGLEDATPHYHLIDTRGHDSAESLRMWFRRRRHAERFAEDHYTVTCIISPASLTVEDRTLMAIVPCVLGHADACRVVPPVAKYRKHER